MVRFTLASHSQNCPKDRSMYGGDEGGLVIKTHLRNLEIVCTDLLGPLRKM